MYKIETNEDEEISKPYLAYPVKVNDNSYREVAESPESALEILKTFTRSTDDSSHVVLPFKDRLNTS